MAELNDAERELKRETGAACMVIGAIFWMVSFIAMFFHPAAWIPSRSLVILEYAGTLALIGTVVFVAGWRVRRKAGA
jgi:energy-converting hydrogenase Eha subunit G